MTKMFKINLLMTRIPAVKNYPNQYNSLESGGILGIGLVSA